MASYKAKSIILKSYKLGESDKIIKIYSIESGIINAVAKGAFNLKSKFLGRLELFNVVDCEISTGKNLDVITQVEIIEHFKNISTDFLKYSICQVISEIILKTQSEKSPSINVFKLLYVVFSKINKAVFEDIITLKKILVFFLAKYLKIMGYVPLFNFCSICGNKLIDNNVLFNENSKINEDNFSKDILFSIKYGGIICENCKSNIEIIDKLILIDKNCANAFNNLFLIKIEDFLNTKLSKEQIDFLLNIIESYFIYHLEVKIDSFDYLKKIKI